MKKVFVGNIPRLYLSSVKDIHTGEEVLNDYGWNYNPRLIEQENKVHTISILKFYSTIF